MSGGDTATGWSGGGARGALVLALVVLGALGVLTACGDPPQPPVVQRLWLAAPDAVTAPPADAHGWETLVDADLRAGSLEGTTPDGPGPVRRIVDRNGDYVPVPFELPADGPLVLRRSSGWSVVTSLPALSGDALAVELTVRGQGAGVGASVNVGAVVQLPEPWEPDARLSAQDVLDLFDPSRHASVTLEGEVGAEARTFSTEFAVEPGTQEIALFLTAPWDGTPERLLFERLVVRRRALSGWLGDGGAVPGLERVERPGEVRVRAGAVDVAGHVRARFDRDEREGLLALAGTRYAWELPAWPEPRQLDLSLGVRPESGRRTVERPLRFSVLADGEAVHEESLLPPTSAAEPAWNDRRITLPASPDGPLRLELVTESTPFGTESPVAVWGHPTVRAPRGPSRPNVVLISLDTLRPDRLGCYGGPVRNSPRLDALAAQGVRFTRAYSTTSYTLPSHASLMTGQFPALHGAVDVVDRMSAERSAFLAEELRRAGFVTAAFTGGGYVSTDYGFGTGFDRYAHNDPVWATETVRGQQLVDTVSWQRNRVQLDLLRRYDQDAVAEWIGAQQEGVPFFLFLHTYIVHNYAPDHARLEAYGLYREDGQEAPFDHRGRTRFNQGETALLEEVYDAYMPYYDATIAMADEFVGTVLDALEAAGVDRDTMIVVTSDHGEEFGEHEFFGHGETLYDSNVRIPMIARLPRPRTGGEGAATGAGSRAAPGTADGGASGLDGGAGGAGGWGLDGSVPAPGTVTDLPVSLVDVAPWILRTAGLEPDPRMSVTPPLGPDVEQPPGRELLFVELDTHRSRKSAVLLDELKLHVQLGEDGEDLETERLELYDVGADPGETRDVRAEREDEVRLLRERLAGLHALGEVLNPRGDMALSLEDLEGMDPALIEQLRALGYLELLTGERDG